MTDFYALSLTIIRDSRIYWRRFGSTIGGVLRVARVPIRAVNPDAALGWIVVSALQRSLALRPTVDRLRRERLGRCKERWQPILTNGRTPTIQVNTAIISSTSMRGTGSRQNSSSSTSQSSACRQPHHGAEALLRWEHPDVLGTLLPGRFIDRAENNGLMVPLTAFVSSRSAVGVTIALTRNRLSVNVSAAPPMIPAC